MPILLMHGLGQTADSWQETLLAAGSPLDVHCPELGDLITEHPACYSDLYRSFCQLCDGLSWPLDLCGLSLGGVLALQYKMCIRDRWKMAQ